jgi:hypothetical protein
VVWWDHLAHQDEGAAAEPPVVLRSAPVALAKVYSDCFCINSKIRAEIEVQCQHS